VGSGTLNGTSQIGRCYQDNRPRRPGRLAGPGGTDMRPAGRAPAEHLGAAGRRSPHPAAQIARAAAGVLG